MAYSYGGWTITTILNQWADFGIFAYALPFLMIFAMVFGILNKTSLLGDNKGVQATIALAVGLLSLQFDYVTNFYATIFPYAGIGISVLLVALILMGLIYSTENKGWLDKVWFGIGVVIFLVVLFTSMSNFSWMGGMGYNFSQAWPAILAGMILLGLMALIIYGGGKKGP
ncbi:hypothetical protein J4218_05020 [Candidatus Pacearchaeota archaeon]|nr:hypothetical protein [Candidatus Pacearchaeota archaeon]